MATYMPPLSEPSVMSSASKIDFKSTETSHVSVQMRASIFQSPARGLSEMPPNRSSLIGHPSSTQNRSLTFASPVKAALASLQKNASGGDQENVHPSGSTPNKLRTPLKTNSSPMSPPGQPKTSPFRVRNEGLMGQSVYKLVKDLKESALERGDTRAAERLRAIQVKVSPTDVTPIKVIPVTETPSAKATPVKEVMSSSAVKVEQKAEAFKTPKRWPPSAADGEVLNIKLKETGLGGLLTPMKNASASPAPNNSVTSIVKTQASASNANSANALPAPNNSATKTPQANAVQNAEILSAFDADACVLTMESDIVVMPALQTELGILSPVSGNTSGVDEGLVRTESDDIEMLEDTSSDAEVQAGEVDGDGKAEEETYSVVQPDTGADAEQTSVDDKEEVGVEEVEMTVVEGGDGLEMTHATVEMTQMTVEGGDGLEGVEDSTPVMSSEYVPVPEIMEPEVQESQIPESVLEQASAGAGQELEEPTKMGCFSLQPPPQPADPVSVSAFDQQDVACPNPTACDGQAETNEPNFAVLSSPSVMSPCTGLLDISSTNAVNNSAHVLLASEQTPLRSTPMHFLPTPNRAAFTPNNIGSALKHAALTPCLAAASPFMEVKAALAAEQLRVLQAQPAAPVESARSPAETQTEHPAADLEKNMASLLQATYLDMERMQKEMAQRYSELESRYEALQTAHKDSVTVGEYMKLQAELDRVKVGLERVETESRRGSQSEMPSPRKKDCKCVIS